MEARGWSTTDFLEISTIRSSLQAQALCRGAVDAVAFVAANPVPVMQEATFACAARLVPLDQDFTRTMIERYPYYLAAVVPGGLYPNNPDPDPDDRGPRHRDRGHGPARRDRLRCYQDLVPPNCLSSARSISPSPTAAAAEMLDQCVFAEVHPGAARYYREARAAACRAAACRDRREFPRLLRSLRDGRPVQWTSTMASIRAAEADAGRARLSGCRITPGCARTIWTRASSLVRGAIPRELCARARGRVRARGEAQPRLFQAPCLERLRAARVHRGRVHEVSDHEPPGPAERSLRRLSRQRAGDAGAPLVCGR